MTGEEAGRQKLSVVVKDEALLESILFAKPCFLGMEAMAKGPWLTIETPGFRERGALKNRRHWYYCLLEKKEGLITLRRDGEKDEVDDG